jgi:hypothetical protein
MDQFETRGRRRPAHASAAGAGGGRRRRRRNRRRNRRNRRRKRGGEQPSLEGPAGQACVDDKGLVAAARIDKVRKVNLLLGAGRGGRPLSGRGG